MNQPVTRRNVLSAAKAATHSKARPVSILEGGYSTEGLALAVEAHLLR